MIQRNIKDGENSKNYWLMKIYSVECDLFEIGKKKFYYGKNKGKIICF